MKIAVTGASGRLGGELLKYDCSPIYADIASPKQLKKEIDAINPDTIIHCAAITDVDGAERFLYKDVQRVNVVGTSCLRTVFDGRIIYLSTDYVFDGQRGPYSETDKPNPISVYGNSKYMGERIIQENQYPADTIVRTTILYGNSSKPDFVKSILKKLKGRETFEVTTSVYGTPTYIPHLADGILQLCEMKSNPRIVNIAGKDCMNRYSFAKLIAEVFEMDGDLILPTKKVYGDAPRPRKAGLVTMLAEKLELPIYPVRDGLEELRNVLIFE